MPERLLLDSRYTLSMLNKTSVPLHIASYVKRLCSIWMAKKYHYYSFMLTSFQYTVCISREALWFLVLKILKKAE